MDDNRVPLVVSLSPFIARAAHGAEVGHLYQALCLDTWRANGFRVVSVNAASEVDQVRAFYPDIEIMVAQRDLGATYGKPLVPLAEMVAALDRLGAEVGGIINSDVYVPPCDFAGWVDAVLRASKDGRSFDCLYMNRREMDHPAASVGAAYPYGFDAFFFRTAALRTVDWEPFAIGIPWWDYYLPMAMLLQGRSLARVAGAPLRHLAHPQKWNQANWRLMFDVFRHRLASAFDELHRAKGDALPILTALIHENQMASYLADHPVEREVEDPGFDAAQRYREGYSISVADLIHQLSDVASFPTPGRLAA